MWSRRWLKIQLQYLVELTSLLTVFSFGLGFGLLLGYFLFKIFRLKKEKVLGKFRGEVLALVYDVNKDTLDIVGLYPIGEGTYATYGPHKAMVVMKPAKVKPKILEPFNKPMLFVIAHSLHGFSLDVTDLAKLGVLKLVLGEEELSKTSLPLSLENILTNLLMKSGETYGYITVSPDFKIGIAYDIPEFVASLTSLITSIGSATLQGIKDVIVGTEHYARIIEKYARVKEAAYGFWLKLVIVSGVILLLFWLVSMFFGR